MNVRHPEGGWSFGTIIVVIAFVFFLFAGFLALVFLKSRSTKSNATNSINSIQNETVVNQNVSVSIPEATDTDQDGLTDDQERSGNTDPLKADTDQDGLTDREEAQTFGTNPLVNDTDGDGFLDGQEIERGYNPKGPGKLFNFERGLQNLNQP